jgi:RND superfamily putative drug exporter
MDLGKHVTQSGFYDEGSQSVQASLLADGAYGRDRTSHVVAILTPPGETKVDDPQWSQRTVEELDAFVAKHDDKVVGWAGWLRAPDSTDATVAQMKTQDMRQTFVSIPLEGDNDDEILKNYQDVAPDLKQINDGDIKLAGLNPLASELTGTIGVDQQRAEIAAIPLVAVLLFFVFGGVVAASLPAIIGGLTILGALGIMRLVADFAPVHFFAQPVVTLIGLGIAIDYGLFIVSRFREEIAEGYDTEAAVRRTVMTAGRTVVFSAVIIVASSLPLLLFPQGFLKSITYAIIASVMLAAVLSITVLAAILAILGPNVDALGVRTLLRVPFLRNWSVSRNIIDWVADKTQKTKTREEVESGFWGKLVNRVMKRPILFAAPIVVLMIVMIIPLGNLALGGISEKYLPPDNPVRVAQEEFDRTFPGFRTEPLTLVISNDDGQPVTDQQVAEIRSRAMAISGFTDPDNNPDAMWKPRPGNSNDPSVRVIQNGLINRNDAAEKIEELREISPPRGVSVYVGGTPALEQDSIHSLYSRLPLMVLLLISTTTILMFLAFGSLVLPIKAALMSALTLGSTMGILTWMFVDGHGSGLMNYTPQPLMAPMIGLIIAVIYGLSTDYEVFLVSRMVEARDRGMSTTESIRVGTATTGRLITAAALVLAVVAGAFVFSDLVMMKYLAFGLLIALLLDATIVRMFLVPAIMKLLGDDCWWAPKWMKRLQHKIGLGETTLPDELKRPVVRQPAGALVSAVAAPAHPVGGPGASTDDAPTTRFGTAKSPEGKSPEGKSPEGKSPEGKSSEGRDIGSWLSEIRGKVLPRSDRVEPSIAGEPTSVIADPAPVEEPPTTAIPTQSTSLSAEETRAIPVSRPASGDSDVATEQLNARAKSNGVSAQDLLRREGRL